MRDHVKKTSPPCACQLTSPCKVLLSGLLSHHQFCQPPRHAVCALLLSQGGCSSGLFLLSFPLRCIMNRSMTSWNPKDPSPSVKTLIRVLWCRDFLSTRYSLDLRTTLLVLCGSPQMAIWESPEWWWWWRQQQSLTGSEEQPFCQEKSHGGKTRPPPWASILSVANLSRAATGNADQRQLQPHTAPHRCQRHIFPLSRHLPGKQHQVLSPKLWVLMPTPLTPTLCPPDLCEAAGPGSRTDPGPSGSQDEPD